LLDQHKRKQRNNTILSPHKGKKKSLYHVIQKFKNDKQSSKDIMRCSEELTVIHLHLKATSRTVLSRNVAAILIYLMILGSSENLGSYKQYQHMNIKHQKKKKKMITEIQK